MIVFLFILVLFTAGYIGYQIGEINTYKYINSEIKRIKEEK